MCPGLPRYGESITKMQMGSNPREGRENPAHLHVDTIMLKLRACICGNQQSANVRESKHLHDFPLSVNVIQTAQKTFCHKVPSYHVGRTTGLPVADAQLTCKTRSKVRQRNCNATQGLLQN